MGPFVYILSQLSEAALYSNCIQLEVLPAPTSRIQKVLLSGNWLLSSCSAISSSVESDDWVLLRGSLMPR